MKTLHLLPLLLALMCSSCVSHKELVNFNEQEINYGERAAIENSIKLRVQPADLLRIDVSSVDPAAAAPFNIGGAEQPSIGQVSTTGLELLSGYLVDQNGMIDVPLLGGIKVEGLTLEEVKAKVSDELTTYLRDPVVTARFLNFKVSVLGEVNAPGIVRPTNPRVTVLEAIGMAGDLTDYANRNEITVVREEEGQRKYERLNLRRSDAFESPFFYLKQNDVIYVRPIRAKTATVADPGQRIVSYGSAFLSVVTLIIAISNR